MNEVVVSASDFRVHLKDLANDVAAGRQRVVMERHGHPMVALVSQQDLKFLRHNKPTANPDGPVPDGRAAAAATAASHATATAAGAAATAPASTPDEDPDGEILLDEQDLLLQARRHPDAMTTEEIERLYAITKEGGHIEAVWWWRLKAYTVLSLRGRCPVEPPMWSRPPDDGNFA
jgi:hypothetical protein